MAHYQKREFAFGGLLTCAYDDCMVTVEFKKEKYMYYRCTGYKGQCDLPRMTEAELGKHLGQVLQDSTSPQSGQKKRFWARKRSPGSKSAVPSVPKWEVDLNAN